MSMETKEKSRIKSGQTTNHPNVISFPGLSGSRPSRLQNHSSASKVSSKSTVDVAQLALGQLRAGGARIATIERAVTTLKTTANSGSSLAKDLRVAIAALDNALTHFRVFDRRHGLQCLQKGCLALKRAEKLDNTEPQHRDLRDTAHNLGKAFSCLLRHYVNLSSGGSLKPTRKGPLDELALADSYIMSAARRAVSHYVKLHS